MIIHKKICLYIHLWLRQCRITVTCCNLRIWRNVGRNIITTDISSLATTEIVLCHSPFVLSRYRLHHSIQYTDMFSLQDFHSHFYYISIGIFLLKFSVINSYLRWTMEFLFLYCKSFRSL